MKILVVEDDRFYRVLLQTALERWGYEVVTCVDGESSLRIFEGVDAPRLAILSWLMPGMDGVEVCKRLRSRKGGLYTYILLLTARSADADVAAGLGAEADDYLVKPFDFDVLRERLRAGSRILDLQSQLRRQAMHDSLTDLYNRAGILQTLESEAVKAEQEASPLSLAIVDIDHFKRINDEFHHAAGDAVLCQLATRMKSRIRDSDSIGRNGGDEFMIVVRGLEALEVFSLVDGVRGEIERSPIRLGDKQIAITISAGVATSTTGKMPDMGLLIQTADHALYAAKALGRNRVEMKLMSNQEITAKLQQDQVSQHQIPFIQIGTQ
jgi:two-component system, cell cycle response regulator